MDPEVDPRELFGDSDSNSGPPGCWQDLGAEALGHEVCLVHHDDMQLHVPPCYREISELPRRIIAIENRLKGLDPKEGFPRAGNFGGPMQLLPASCAGTSKARMYGSPATKRRRTSYSAGPSSSGSAWDVCSAVQAPEVDESDLLLVHSERHIARVREACALAVKEGAAFLPLTQSPGRLTPQADDADGDVYYSPDSLVAFKRAAGGSVEAVRRLFRIDPGSGRASGRSRFGSSYAIVRPPGHHCCDAPSGFCFFNNAAIAACHARAVLGLSRVAIVDWDYHHGDGTQRVFYKDPSVLTISLHVAVTADGMNFPKNKSMGLERNGLGLGRGYNVNIPWPHDAVGATEYDEAMRSIVVPALKGFNPELIIVSAGFDAVAGDMLAGTQLQPSSYHAMTRQLLALHRPIAVVLEGGYTPTLLAEASLNVVHALLGRQPPDPLEPASSPCLKSTASPCRKPISSPSRKPVSSPRLRPSLGGNSGPNAATGPLKSLLAEHILDAVRRRLNTLPPWSGMRCSSGEGPYFGEKATPPEAAGLSAAAAEQLAQLIEREAELDTE